MLRSPSLISISVAGQIVGKYGRKYSSSSQIRFYSPIDAAVIEGGRICLNPPVQSPGHLHGQLENYKEMIMAKATNPIPQGYHTVTPSLTCRDAAKAIDFYRKAIGAQAHAVTGRQQG